ncbi:FLYWCH zinc finger domain, partial [Brachionus plicatilis]
MRCVVNGCKAKCCTDGMEIGSEYLVSFKNTSDDKHPTHAQKNGLIERKEKRRKIKEATTTIAKIAPTIAWRQILNSFANEIRNKEAIALMPSYDADRQAIKRFKRSVRPNYPPEPKLLSDITLPDFLTHTLEDAKEETQAFLIYDSGVEDPNRFFMFGTEENFSLIETAHLFADGTFSIAPKLFEQVYTIHALIKGRCVPLIYCLLPRKNQKIYEDVLTVVKSKINNQPLSFTTDFELAFINAVTKIFPN